MDNTVSTASNNVYDITTTHTETQKQHNKRKQYQLTDTQKANKAEYNRQYRSRNKEKISDYNRQYRLKQTLKTAANDTAEHNQQYHLQQIAVTEICDIEPSTKRVRLNSDANFTKAANNNEATTKVRQVKCDEVTLIKKRKQAAARSKLYRDRKRQHQQATRATTRSTPDIAHDQPSTSTYIEQRDQDIDLSTKTYIRDTSDLASISTQQNDNSTHEQRRACTFISAAVDTINECESAAEAKRRKKAEYQKQYRLNKKLEKEAMLKLHGTNVSITLENGNETHNHLESI
jgi:hypothetical protein